MRSPGGESKEKRQWQQKFLTFIRLMPSWGFLAVTAQNLWTLVYMLEFFTRGEFHTEAEARTLDTTLHPGTKPGKTNALAGASEEAFSSSLVREIIAMASSREPYGQRQALAVACHQRSRLSCTFPEIPGANICWYSFFWLNWPMHILLFAAKAKKKKQKNKKQNKTLSKTTH